MTIEREVLNVTGKSKQEGEEELEFIKDSEHAPETMQERRARIATILERGIINTRLNVELPPDIHGEWVREDSVQIERMKSLGFEIDLKYGNKTALHSTGAGTIARVGDVIFMTCPQEDYELIQEVKRERYLEQHDPKALDELREERSIEEQNFAAQLKAQAPELPVIEESSKTTAHKEDIQAALDSRGG